MKDLFMIMPGFTEDSKKEPCLESDGSILLYDSS